MHTTAPRLGRTIYSRITHVKPKFPYDGEMSKFQSGILIVRKRHYEDGWVR